MVNYRSSSLNIPQDVRFILLRFDQYCDPNTKLGRIRGIIPIGGPLTFSKDHGKIHF